MNVLVAGGTGFIGRVLSRELLDRGHAVTVLSRSPDESGLPNAIESVAADVTQPNLTDAVAGHDVVVNLVALPSHVSPSGQDHDAVHRDGTANLVAASEQTDVDRFVQLSALGVESTVDTAYFRAKRAAESIVRDADLDWVIVRPSVVFGDGCAFLPFLQRVTPLGIAALPDGGTMRIQPIWVGDLAPILADCVEDETHVGHVYEIGGPETLTLADTIRTIQSDATVFPVPKPLAAAGFTLAEAVPVVPFDRDQYRAFSLDNTTTDNAVTAFGFDTASLRTLSQYVDKE